MRLYSFANAEYLNLLEKVLSYSFWPEPLIDEKGNIHPGGIVSPEQRESGTACWPAMAFTMIGNKRLRNIRELCLRVIDDNIEGGFAECGVWRGGACIYARACLPEHRPIWVCDSFCGMPAVEGEMKWQELDLLKVSKEQVQKNFEMFGLLENVRFVEGYFHDSLPAVEGPIAILRMDGDMHKSTTDILTHLWPKVSPGGFVIVDDYSVIPECKQAVHDFFKDDMPELTAIDDDGVWFQKTCH